MTITYEWRGDCAWDGGMMAGFVNVGWDGGDHAFVLDAVVARSHRSRGVGPRSWRPRPGAPGPPAASGPMSPQSPAPHPCVPGGRGQRSKTPVSRPRARTGAVMAGRRVRGRARAGAAVRGVLSTWAARANNWKV